jgi:gluconolactonase
MKTWFVFGFIWLSGVMVSQIVSPEDSLVMAGAIPEKAGSGFGFTEGCSVAVDGRVFFTDQPNDRIYSWDENTGISLFKSGCERSNGTYFDRDGNLVACADLKNRLVKFSPSGLMTEVFSGSYKNACLNGPNDLWIDSKGGIYFTDPYYHRDYWDKDHRMMQEVQGVYYLKPSGEIMRVIDDLVQPNGIVGTREGFLYVADIGAGKTWKYTINADGSLGNKTHFADAGSDGMTVDEDGNVYLTFGQLKIYNSQGKLIREISIPESPSNVCFGGRGKNIIFITARTSVYTLKMNTRGVE